MTVMVTGGGGLLGSRIVNKLLARGETVVSFDTNAEQPRLETQAKNPQLKRVAGDIRTYDQLSARIREFSVKRIIHMAAVRCHASFPRQQLAKPSFPTLPPIKSHRPFMPMTLPRSWCAFALPKIYNCRSMPA